MLIEYILSMLGQYDVHYQIPDKVNPEPLLSNTASRHEALGKSCFGVGPAEQMLGQCRDKTVFSVPCLLVRHRS